MQAQLKENADAYDNKMDAYFVQLAYRWNKFTPYLRYDSFDDEDKWNGDGEHIQTFGFNYNIESDVFLKLEFASIEEGEDVWQSQISLAF